MSVRDSDNALIDSGQLKELAVVLSIRLKSVAVLTSVYESDRFEFIGLGAAKGRHGQGHDDPGQPPNR